MPRARRRGDLNEREPADPLRPPLEQALHRPQPLLDALGVVEPIDADADRLVVRQAVPPPHLGPALRDRAWRSKVRRGRPLDRNGIPLHRRQLAPVRHGERLAIDPRLELPIDRVDEVVAMKLRVEPENAAAEQAVEQLLPPRANRERFRIRPRNVPERNDRRSRQRLPDHARQQREVIVLDEHDRVAATSLPRPPPRAKCD